MNIKIQIELAVTIKTTTTNITTKNINNNKIIIKTQTDTLARSAFSVQLCI